MRRNCKDSIKNGEKFPETIRKCHTFFGHRKATFRNTLANLIQISGDNSKISIHNRKNKMCCLRGRSDKYLTSLPKGVTIAREIYSRVVHSRRRLLLKFQSNRTRSFVLTACRNGRVRGFYKNGRRAISVGDSILVFGRKSRSEIKERLEVVYGDSSPSMATVKIGLTSFNVVARWFLMSHAQVHQKQLPRRIT